MPQWIPFRSGDTIPSGAKVRKIDKRWHYDASHPIDFGVQHPDVTITEDGDVAFDRGYVTTDSDGDTVCDIDTPIEKARKAVQRAREEVGGAQSAIAELERRLKTAYEFKANALNNLNAAQKRVAEME